MAMSGLTLISATIDNDKDQASTLIGRPNSCTTPEPYLEHETGQTGDEIITINVSGKRFETYKKTLEQFPDTLLGNPSLLERFYNAKADEYFLDRNQSSFPAVLHFYQSGGTIYVPNTVPREIHYDELDFYRIQFRNQSASPMRQYRDRIASTTFPGNTQNGDTNCSRLQTLRWRLWEFLECPESSIYSRIWALLDVVVIMLSILTVVLESMPDLQGEGYKYAFSIIDTICVAFFTFDFLIRLIICPSFVAFVKTPLNILDFLAIMPFYLELAVGRLVQGGALTTFKVLRIFRIMRVMKLIRHSKRLILMGRVIQDCLSELTLLLIIWLMGVLTFGTVMYYIESEKENNFDSILHSCWWAVVSISTVGYGDMYPKTGLGKLVGSCLLFISMVYLALPMTVIVSKFNKAFEKFKEDEQAASEAKEQFRTILNSKMHSKSSTKVNNISA